VTFQGNTAASGGALAVLGGTVTLSGLTTFIGNNAANDGGAVYVNKGSLIVNGPVCAQDNTVSGSGVGTFLWVDGFPAGVPTYPSVVLNNIVNINGSTSTANDIYNRDGGLRCGSSGSNWPSAGYGIIGDACACNQQFVNGSNTTCDSCVSWAGMRLPVNVR